MRAAELFSGVSEPAPLRDLLGRVHARVLLSASGARDELAIDRAFRERIGRGAEVWSLPGVAHTKGLEERPGAYASRVTAFLRDALTR